VTLYDRLFPRWRPPGALRPTRAPSSGALRITWLGTAGHVLETGRTTILIDPFVTRTPLRKLVRKIEPNDDAIQRWIPKKVDVVLCGHSHYDHLLDAPRIAKITGAKIVGSRSTSAFARAAGVPEDRIVTVPASGARMRFGDVEVRFVPSLHGKIVLGRVPFPGEVTRPPRLPVRAWHYKMGGAFGLLVRAAGVSVYHNGSADLLDAEVAGERADVLLVGLAGRRATRDYLGRLSRALGPSVVLPTHHDAFFAPLEEGLRLLPGIDLDGFAQEVRTLLPLATIVTPDYGEHVLVDAGDTRAAGIARA
jgi:L-ascorbate metabolism protein UlaG (beta-lactamase superfamily)